jgi:hypothetical protein
VYGESNQIEASIMTIIQLPEPEHTCLSGPLCSYWFSVGTHHEDPGACAHSSCMAIVCEPCMACQIEAYEPAPTRLVPSAADPDPTCPHDGSRVRYVADYGAPGCGQAWECARGHSWAKVGGEFYDPAEQVHILTVEDVI